MHMLQIVMIFQSMFYSRSTSSVGFSSFPLKSSFFSNISCHFRDVHNIDATITICERSLKNLLNSPEHFLRSIGKYINKFSKNKASECSIWQWVPRCPELDFSAPIRLREPRFRRGWRESPAR